MTLAIYLTVYLGYQGQRQGEPCWSRSHLTFDRYDGIDDQSAMPISLFDLVSIIRERPA